MMSTNEILEWVLIALAGVALALMINERWQLW